MNNILKQSLGQSTTIALSVPDRAWHNMASNVIESHFGTDSSTGLDDATVLQRLAQFGPNRLAEAKQQTIWQVFLEEIREPVSYPQAFASGLHLLSPLPVDGGVTRYAG